MLSVIFGRSRISEYYVDKGGLKPQNIPQTWNKQQIS